MDFRTNFVGGKAWNRRQSRDWQGFATQSNGKICRKDMRNILSVQVLSYRQEGDFLLPELELETPSTWGKYGRMRERYLREERPMLYNRLLLSGKLTAQLAEIDRTANRRLEQMMPELKKSMGLTEQMKASEPMKWVGLMNNAKSKAEEMILSELIYS